jgi:hypothetical protein
MGQVNGVGDVNALFLPSHVREGTIAPYTYNVTRTNTAVFRAAYAAMASNIGILLEGDSTIRGVDEIASPYNSQYGAGGIHTKLAALLNATGVAAGASNLLGICGPTLADYLARDGRLTVTGGTVLGSNKYIGGTEIRLPGVTSGAIITVKAANTADIYWGDQGATGRIMSVKVDGGAPINIPTTGVARIAKTTIALGAVGDHTLTFDWVSGGTTLLVGVDAYDNTRPQLSILNGGISGGVPANFIDDAGTPGAGRKTQVALMAPKLILSECGLVNAVRTSIGLSATYTQLTQRVLDAKAAGADFIFIEPPFDNGTTGDYAIQSQYVDKMYLVADEQNVGVARLRSRWVSYLNCVQLGYVWNGDNTHPSLPGKIDEAYMLRDIVYSIK